LTQTQVDNGRAQIDNGRQVALPITTTDDMLKAIDDIRAAGPARLEMYQPLL